MKIGKVFARLEGHKNTLSISYGDNGATVTLKPGLTSGGVNSKLCKNAHETRLFIEAATGTPAVSTPTPSPAAQAAIAQTIVPATDTPVAANCDKTTLVDADWVRDCGIPELVDACGTARKVRLTPMALLGVVLGNIETNRQLMALAA